MYPGVCVHRGVADVAAGRLVSAIGSRRSISVSTTPTDQSSGTLSAGKAATQFWSSLDTAAAEGARFETQQAEVGLGMGRMSSLAPQPPVAWGLCAEFRRSTPTFSGASEDGNLKLMGKCRSEYNMVLHTNPMCRARPQSMGVDKIKQRRVTTGFIEEFATLAEIKKHGPHITGSMGDGGGAGLPSSIGLRVRNGSGSSTIVSVGATALRHSFGGMRGAAMRGSVGERVGVVAEEDSDDEESRETDEVRGILFWS